MDIIKDKLAELKKEREEIKILVLCELERNKPNFFGFRRGLSRPLTHFIGKYNQINDDISVIERVFMILEA